MSAVSITAASCIPSSAASYRFGVLAGVAITAGQLVYVDSAGLAQLSDSNNTAAASVEGIAANSAAAGQPVAILKTDDALALGGTTTAGTTYCLGATAGSVVPQADLTTLDRIIIVGVGKASNKIRFAVMDTGIVL